MLNDYLFPNCDTLNGKLIDVFVINGEIAQCIEVFCAVITKRKIFFFL